MPTTQPRDSTPLRCHGRATELDRVDRLFHAAVQGNGAAFVLVTGRPAIGKSTLLGELQHRLHRQGALTLETRCAPGLGSHAPLLQVARRAWEHLCGDGVEARLSGPVDELFDLLQGRPEAGGQAEHRPALRLQLYERLAHLLRLIGDRQPAVVLIHDLDLADRPTLGLLTYLGRTLAGRAELTARPFRGLFVASAREAPDELLELERAGGLNLVHLDLGGLDADGVRNYLRSDEVVQRFVELTHGDPALLEAMTRQPPPSTTRTPLAEASPSEARLLELLAVFGRPLGAETLRLLTDLPLSELGRCIAALTRRGVLEKRVVGGELRVAIARAGDQRAIYDALTPAHRCALHGQVSDYLEGQGEQELETCASHLLRSGRKAKAVTRVLAAGERLERALCFERATELYEQALALAGDQRALELCRRLWRVLQLTGRLDRALDFAERCRQARPDDIELSLELSHLHLLRRDPAAAREVLNNALEQPDSAEHQVQLLALAARACYQSGERGEARAQAEQGLALLEQGEPDTNPLQRLSLQNTLGKLCLEEGQRDQAAALLEDNLRRARASGLATEAALALIQLGLMALEAHDFDEAERLYHEALELTGSIGEHRLRGACLQHLGVIAERRCLYDQALARYQEAVTVWKQAWLRGYLSWAALDLGQLYLRLGHAERARAMAELSERMEGSDTTLRTRINHALLRGGIARHACHYGEADVWFRQAEELAAGADQTDRQLESRLELAELRLEQGLPRQALGLLDPPEDAPPHLGLRGLLLQGRALLAAEEIARARAPLAEALELADRLPEPEVAWQSRYLLAVVALEQGRAGEARRLLGQAARLEAEVRQHVPAELAEMVADQPLRRGLEQALRQQGGPARGSATPRRSAGSGTGSGTNSFAGMVGRSTPMQQVYAYVEKVASTDAIVLIRGESGTGKELITDAIHRRSRRTKQPLVKVNCSALVESLLLSELFGHERGAFTGATERRKGRFEAADGGTIFLDEIGDISPATQVALLRVLQQQEFERVGGTTPIKVDVRIICATNCNLEQLVADGSFREDLYYRLKGFVIDMPPLRERAEDFPLLCEHFLAMVARERNAPARRLADAALQMLRRHRWPGNIRELENVLRSVSLLSDSELLEVADFADYPELTRSTGDEPDGGDAPLPAYEQIRRSGIGLREYKKQIEHDCIVEALQESGGSIAGAARLLGIKRPRLSQLVKEHCIAVHKDR